MMSDDDIMEAITAWQMEHGYTDAMAAHVLSGVTDDVDPEVFKACKYLVKPTRSPRMDAAWQALRHEWIRDIKTAAQREGVPGLFE